MRDKPVSTAVSSNIAIDQVEKSFNDINLSISSELTDSTNNSNSEIHDTRLNFKRPIVAASAGNIFVVPDKMTSSVASLPRDVYSTDHQLSLSTSEVCAVNEQPVLPSPDANADKMDAPWISNNEINQTSTQAKFTLEVAADSLGSYHDLMPETTDAPLITVHNHESANVEGKNVNTPKASTPVKKLSVKKEPPFYIAESAKYAVFESLDPDLKDLLDIVVTDDVKKAPKNSESFYPSEEDPTLPKIEFELVEGKNRVKSASLAGLINLLVSEKDVDLNIVSDFLLTYQNFSDPVDVARLLILKYLDCTERILTQNASNSKVSGMAPTKDSSVLETNWNPIIQMKILNVIRKWVEHYGYDFERNRTLSRIVMLFLQKEVVGKDVKKSSFVSSITKKLEDIQLNVNLTVSAELKSQSFFEEDSQLSFLDIDPDVIANELALIEHEYFCKIRVTELFQQMWANKDKALREENSPNVLKFIANFNKTAFGVASVILSTSKPKDRVEVLKRFIFIAHQCAKIHAYNTCFEIVAGLNLGAVSKLKKTWASLPNKYTEVWERLGLLVTNEGNYRSYRNIMNVQIGHPPAVPVVPYLGMYLSDLTFIEDGNPTYIDHEHSIIINFSKFRMLSSVLKTVLDFQKNKYSRPSDPDARLWLKTQWKVLPEAELYRLAKECEAQQSVRRTTLSSSGANLRDLLNGGSNRDLANPAQKLMGRTRSNSNANGAAPSSRSNLSVSVVAGDEKEMRQDEKKGWKKIFQ